MKIANCLADHDLMPLIDGADADASVIAHLESCPDCRRRMESLKSEFRAVRAVRPGVSAGDPTIPAITPDRPAMIGEYVVVGILDDAGGQATVYRAVHQRLGRDVVIKLGRQRLDENSQTAHLLVKEGQVLAQLEHEPNIAPVYDLALHEGKPYLAMKYIRGRSLEQEGAGRRLSARQAAAIVAKVARALAAAHALDVVHQDIKPRNIMIDAADHKPYLIDFGIARLRQAFAEASDDPGVIGGTLSYISPEQARREPARIGPRSDIFCLGGTLFYLLTGAAPFAGKEAAELMDHAQRCDFNQSLLKSHGAPSALRKICLRAMAAQPEDRYDSAQEMADALDRYQRRPLLIRRSLAGVLIAAVATGAAAAVYHLLHPAIIPAGGGQSQVQPPPQVDPNQKFIQILRKDAPMDLASALPIHRDDQVVLTYEIPQNWHYAMFAMATDGTLSKLSPSEAPGKSGTTLLKYPGHGQAAPLDARQGTEFVFVTASPNLIDEEAVRAVLESAGPLPRLPRHVVVQLTPDKVDAVSINSDNGPEFGAGVPNPLPGVEDVLDDVRQALLKQKISAMTGVAFSY